MFDRTRLLRVMVFPLSFFAAQVSSAQALPDNSQWVDLTNCKMPAKAPKKPQELDKRYNFQRRRLDLDGDGLCEVMDFWIERLGNSDSPGMRTQDYQFLVYRGGRWQPFNIDVKYFPYALRSRTTGGLMLIDAARADDVGDDMVIRHEVARVFEAPKWRQEDPGFVSRLLLTEIPPGSESASVLQELAVLLARKLATIRNSPNEPYKVQIEKERVVWLLQVARQTLPASQWVPVDAEGLPALRE